MDINQLKDFLILSSQFGYAADTPPEQKKEKDGSTTITYQSGNWQFHDNYFGGEPYAGREVVFYKQQAVWTTVYYGQVDHTEENFPEIYKILRLALRQPDKQFPLRGPKDFQQADYHYTLTWTGDLSKFSAKEIITKNNKEVYQAAFIGGLVNVRKE